MIEKLDIVKVSSLFLSKSLISFQSHPGSGFIVGLLLMQMPEEEAFAVLVQIMQQHRMRDMFKPSM